MSYRKTIKDGEVQLTVANGIAFVQEFCHGLAREGGWYNDKSTGIEIERNEGEMIALMHSELSEALEGMRKDSMDDHLPDRKMVEVELADAIIRILDYAGYKELDVAGALVEKLAYNCDRADHKLENRNAKGGKAF